MNSSLQMKKPSRAKTPEVFNVDNPVQAGGAARGYYWLASFGGRGCCALPFTVALGYCLDRYALSERELCPKINFEKRKQRIIIL